MTQPKLQKSLIAERLGAKHIFVVQLTTVLKDMFVDNGPLNCVRRDFHLSSSSIFSIARDFQVIFNFHA